MQQIKTQRKNDRQIGPTRTNVDRALKDFYEIDILFYGNEDDKSYIPPTVLSPVTNRLVYITKSVHSC